MKSYVANMNIPMTFEGGVVFDVITELSRIEKPVRLASVVKHTTFSITRVLFIIEQMVNAEIIKRQDGDVKLTFRGGVLAIIRSKIREGKEDELKQIMA